MKLLVKQRKLNIAIIVLAIVWLFNSCGCNNATTSQSSIKSDPKIIFLNYNIKKTDNNDRNIKFINKIITDGKLKNSKPTNDGVIGDLECLQLDKKSKVLESFIIKNPLIKDIEYVNDAKLFKTKRIDLNSTSFSLRLQLNPSAKYISIRNFSDSKKQIKPLIKTPIY